MKNISPCLWFDAQAEEAAKFYETVFENAKINQVARYSPSAAKASGQKEGSVMTVDFQIQNLQFLGLNGGPMFKFNQAFSFFVSCTSEKEINEKWKKLSEGGQVRMGLDKYPWAEKYGWTADQFGVEWQLILTPGVQKISPSFLFADELFGRGEEAIQFYISLFPNSKIETIVRNDSTKSVMHCAFTLNGQAFTLMEGEGKHGSTLNQAVSLVVHCENQNEIDHYWNKLSAGGSTNQCGWLSDKYGLSWQIVPTVLGLLMKNPQKAEKVMAALMKMTKLDIATLEQAAQ